MKEVWKEIKGFNFYEVSNFGKVRSLKHQKGIRKKPKLLKLNPYNKYGHLRVDLCLNKKKYHRTIHQLVLEAFVGKCSEGKEARHLDGNPVNNILSNLKWDTHKKNMKDRIKHGTLAQGSKNGWSKLTEKDIKEIRKKYKKGNGTTLAVEFNVSRTTIHGIIKRKYWKQVA